MEVVPSARTRADRLVADARVILAVFSLVAIYLDPAEPAKFRAMTYSSLWVYVFYSIAVALAALRSPGSTFRWSLTTHVIDLAAFSFFIFLTEAPNSPFFVYFVFALFSATLRFRWKGTAWTAAVALTIYAGLGIYSEVLHQPEFELNRFIIRSVYLSLVAVFLVYLARYQEKLDQELVRLAGWAHVPVEQFEHLVESLLGHAAATIGSPRAMIVWEKEAEPWFNIGWLADEEFSFTRERHDAYEAFVDPSIATAGFIVRNAGAPNEQAYRLGGGTVSSERAALHPDFVRRFQIEVALCVPLNGDIVSGWLLFLDLGSVTADDLVLADIVATVIGSRLDHFVLVEQVQSSAIAEERVRLARDLHDGLLQSLTGAALQLQALHRQLPPDPETIRERLRKVQELISADQRELRHFIEQLKPRAEARVAESPLAARLALLRERFQRQWGLEVQFELGTLGSALGDALRQEVYSIVHESVANVAKHAGASLVRIRLELVDEHVEIRISDNGHGFPFKGRYDLQSLSETKRGPVSLKERIASLGGDLRLDSSESGSRLEISVPLEAEGI